MKKKLSKCEKCGAYIDLSYSEYSPSDYAGRAGTKDEPRCAGDYDNICDVCDYGN